MITRHVCSLQHPTVKHLIKLRESREYRYEQRKVLISGIKMLSEISHPFCTLIVKEGFTPPPSIHAEQIISVSESVLKKITGLPSPEPFAAEIAMAETPDFSNIQSLLILDKIADPGNLGTLMRTALALGWEGIFLLPGSTDPYNEKALRAAKGATFKLPWKFGEWNEVVTLLKAQNFQLLAADLNAEPLTHLCITPPIALVLGNESQGLDQTIKEKAVRVTIPLHGKMESLNVAIAGAILMYNIKAKL